jgi:protein-arginine kinase activator protein McsA
MAYAVGKYSQAICDRCGFQYPYLEMREEWNGHKVCPECFETKHPQLDPIFTPTDPQAIYKPRVDRKEPLVVQVGESVFNETAPLQMITSVGIVTVSVS